MKKILTVAGIAVVATGLLTGCFNPVPKTTISGSIGGQSFALSNPKNTTVTNLLVEVQTNGAARLSIGYLSSANDSNIVSGPTPARPKW